MDNLVGQFLEVEELEKKLTDCYDFGYDYITSNGNGSLCLVDCKDREGNIWQFVVNGLGGDSMIENAQIIKEPVRTVEDVVEETGLQLWNYVFDPKWFGDEENYRNIDAMLKTVGYELKDKQWVGEYGDYKGYKNCEVVECVR